MIVLGSTSKYRADLLNRLGLPFETANPACDESPLPNEAAQSLAARLALGKASSLAAHYPKNIIIGSDQVAALGQETLGKPGSAEKACAQLERMQRRSVEFYTAVCVLDTTTNRTIEFIDITAARMRALSAEEIKRYVQIDTPLDCAGSFKVESLGISLFDSIESKDPTALIGLPLIQLCRVLRELGVSVP